MNCPTNEEVDNHSRVTWKDDNGDFQIGYACWYPQMGGYSSKCIVHPHENGCFDAYVWHDGKFPFDETSGRNPAMIHHCVADQFIEFGIFAKRVSEPL